MVNRGRDRRSATEYERAIVGAMLFSDEIVDRANAVLKEQDFKTERYRVVFNAIRALRAARQVIVPETLRLFLIRMGQYQQAGRLPGMEEVIGYANTEAPIEYYAKAIKDELREP